MRVIPAFLPAATFVLSLVLNSLSSAQNAPKGHVRFFNDSAKTANFYVDSQFGCSIPANPEENNAYCDAETAVGKHAVSVKGEKVRSQSCELYVVGREGVEPGAEAHLSKGERLNCMSYAYD
jgi:hypothetical protein